MKKFLTVFLSLLLVVLFCGACNSTELKKLSLSVGESSISIGDTADSVLEILGDPESIYDSYDGIGIIWRYDSLEITQLDGEIVAISITNTNPYSVCGIRYGDSKESVLEKLSKIGSVKEDDDSASITVEFDGAKGIVGTIEDQVEFNSGISGMTEEELWEFGSVIVLFDENDKVTLVSAYNQICNVNMLTWGEETDSSSILSGLEESIPEPSAEPTPLPTEESAPETVKDESSATESSEGSGSFLMNLPIQEIELSNGLCGKVIVIKDILADLTSEEEFVEFVDARVKDGGYNWFTIDLMDGTGLVFVGSNTSVVSYGEIDTTDGSLLNQIHIYMRSGDSYNIVEE